MNYLYRRSVAVSLIFIVVMAIFPVVASIQHADAGNTSLASQVVNIMNAEAARGEIKAGIMGVSCAPNGQEERISDDRQRSLEENLGNQLAADLIREIERPVNRTHIAIIERERLDVILREKELQVTGLTEQYATSIGGLAGLDIILLGTCRGYREPALISVKAIRVKDGKVLGIASRAEARTALVDIVTDVRAHSWNAVPLNMEDGGTITVTITVERGNPVNIDLLTSAEFDKFKRDKKYKRQRSFEADKTKRYSRSAYLPAGEHMIVITDKALGVTSHHSSDVRVVAYFEPE